MSAKTAERGSCGPWPRPWHLIVAVVTSMLAVVGGTPGVLAQDEGGPAPKTATSISVSFEESRMEGLPHYLAARLLTADGSAVVGERVQIRRNVDVFGGRTVTIGRAATDNAGIARVPIEPREKFYAITASFGGTEALSPATVEDDIVFPTELVTVPENVPRSGLVDPQLRPLADVMPWAIGAAVAVVWLVLIVLTVVTLRTIHTAGRSATAAPGRTSAQSPGTGSGAQRG